MESAPRQPRPAPADSSPLTNSSEQFVKPKIPIGVGNFYRDKVTGLQWMLAGYRSGRQACLIHESEGTERDIRDHMPISVIEAEYEFVDCNHDNYCCTIHNTHTMPHRGCLMR